MAAFGFGGGHAARVALPQVFEEEYNCYSFAFQDKTHLEGSDKIFLPPSALDTLARLHIDYPMLFQITCKASGRKTHCGVLEFSAAEGSCYLPYWMMQNLLLEEGGFLQVKNVSLPKATFVKFRPQSVDFLDITNPRASVDFLDITNPRAVLERALRSFSCVTVGDQICIPHNNKFYHIEVREVQPGDAACIIETDCNVDFEPPVGYVEPSAKNGGGGSLESKAGGSMSSAGSVITPRPLSAKGGYADDREAEAKQQAAKPVFVGSGKRLDGKAAAACSATTTGANGSSASLDASSTLGVSNASSSLSSSLTAPGAATPVLGRTLTGGGGGGRSGAAAPMEGVAVGGGGRSLGGAGATAGAGAAVGGARKPAALAQKYAQKKTSFASFSGAGNKLS